MKPSTLRILFVTLLASTFALSASAQKRYNQDYPAYESGGDYVTVYEDCDFRGNSRALTPGDYQDVRDLKLGNDAISSVQVPRGMSIVLFEHERMRGNSTVISSDVRCLNPTWNNEASSLRVEVDSNNGRRGYNDRDDRGTNQGYNGGSRGRDLTAGVSYVVFANTALEQTRGQEWRIVNNNGSIENYREVARDRQSITLQHNRINQSVRIDLSANQVQFFQPNGKRVEYRIESAQSQNRNRGVSGNRGRQEGGVINSSCFTYRAYTRGGDGGLRFHGQGGFERFTTKPQTGRICHDGPLTMEISKTNKATEVVVDINGRSYRFAPNEREDAYLNSWYRKKVRLQVGR